MTMGKRVRCVGVAALLPILASWAAGQDENQTTRTESPPDAKTTNTTKAGSSLAEFGAEPDRVVKSDQEWRRLLPTMSYLVTRHKATEPPWSGVYSRSHAQGIFTCICCGAELFSSKHKFQSGTGWPSFYRPIDPSRLESAMDYTNPYEARVEVECRRCGAHLGHVFQDGPPPTGLRFCINSVALKLKPFPTDTKAAKSTSTSKSKTQSKAQPNEQPKAKSDAGPATTSPSTTTPAQP